MRGLSVALCLLVCAPVLAGCLGSGLAPAATTDAPALTLDKVPEGAKVETLPDGLRLVFDAVEIPFETTLAIPAGATLVRATGIAGADEYVSVTMRHAETERRRCNFAPVDAWYVPVLGQASCTGVTAVDRLPDEWIVRAAGAVTKATLQVDLLTTPYDGIMAQLDLAQLSMRDHELAKTEVQMVPSFDGTLLRVEVTLPQGPGPWPAILWSSPYNHDDRVFGGNPAAWKYFVRDWAERGYAVVSADVRGYGDSGGCVEVWGINEQKDQKFLVDWIAEQAWSDGNVGFYGQSYVATTPVEAAVQAPDALKAIVIVAPVNDAYQDWHFGGVPNGENSLSPVGYQLIGGGVFSALEGPDGLAYAAERIPNGFCDPTVTVRGSDPRAVYDAFYEERNFSARASGIKAATLYTQGFEDSNVKSQMIPDFFNAITAPKLGLFGHWVHQHPTRADNEVLMLGWMDQYVKGKPLGFEKLPAVHVVANDGTQRAASEWPPLASEAATFGLDLDEGALLEGAEGKGQASLLLDAVGNGLALVPSPLGLLPIPTLLPFDGEALAGPVHLAGQATVEVSATLRNAENGYVAAYLYEREGDESSLVTWGMLNLAHRFGHDRYEPVKPGEALNVAIPLLPTEWVFRPGTRLHLELRGATVTDWALIQPSEPATLEMDGAGTRLVLPLADTQPEPLAATAQR